jgi:hypothetical protein
MAETLEFPTLVYHVPGVHRGPGGSTFDFRDAIDERRFGELIAQGWHPTLADAISPAPEPSLLDKAAPEIIAALPELDGEALLALYDAEKAGKTRKGVIAAIEEAIGKVVA